MRRHQRAINRLNDLFTQLRRLSRIRTSGLWMMACVTDTLAISLDSFADDSTDVACGAFGTGMSTTPLDIGGGRRCLEGNVEILGLGINTQIADAALGCSCEPACSSLRGVERGENVHFGFSLPEERSRLSNLQTTLRLRARTCDLLIYLLRSQMRESTDWLACKITGATMQPACKRHEISSQPDARQVPQQCASLSSQLTPASPHFCLR